MTATSIVILTRGRVDLTRRCVESIRYHTEESIEFIFVDNGSPDDTLDYLSTIPGATIIANEGNKGFAAGCNQGMAAAMQEHILLLNNDTVVTPGWLKGLHACLARDSSIGIVGPVSDHVAPIQRVQAPVFASSEELNDFAGNWRSQHADSGFYSHKLIGFCMLFHRDLLDTVGGFDERFYPGNYEDDDFSIRTRLSGLNLWIANDIFIHHEGHGTYRENGNYALSSLRNAEKFREKWNVGLSAFEIDHLGYNPSVIVARHNTYGREQLYIPLGSSSAADS